MAEYILRRIYIYFKEACKEARRALKNLRALRVGKRRQERLKRLLAPTKPRPQKLHQMGGPDEAAGTKKGGSADQQSEGAHSIRLAVAAAGMEVKPLERSTSVFRQTSL